MEGRGYICIPTTTPGKKGPSVTLGQESGSFAMIKGNSIVSADQSGSLCRFESTVTATSETLALKPD